MAHAKNGRVGWRLKWLRIAADGEQEAVETAAQEPASQPPIDLTSHPCQRLTQSPLWRGRQMPCPHDRLSRRWDFHPWSRSSRTSLGERSASETSLAKRCTQQPARLAPSAIHFLHRRRSGRSRLATSEHHDTRRYRNLSVCRVDTCPRRLPCWEAYPVTQRGQRGAPLRAKLTILVAQFL